MIDYNGDGKIDDFDKAIEYELYGDGEDRFEDDDDPEDSGKEKDDDNGDDAKK